MFWCKNLLKSIQEWLHNNILKKHGFGWLYMDCFWHFPILLTDDCILFGPHFIGCHKRLNLRSFDLFIQDDKKILFILEFRSIMQPSFVFNLLEQENEGNPDRSCSSAWSTWLVHLHLLQWDAGRRESVLQGEHREVPLKNACKYYLFHTPFTILLHDFIFDSFVVTPVLTLPSPCNLLFVCNIHCTI
jgi:hypothetical protein